MWSIETGGVEPAKPVTAKLRYGPGVPQGRNPTRLGVYLCCPLSGKWTWVGGVVDPNTDTITLQHLCGAGQHRQLNRPGPGTVGQGAVDTLLGTDLVTGLPGDSFDPSGVLTRTQLAVLLAKAVGTSAPGRLSRFSDAAAIPPVGRDRRGDGGGGRRDGRVPGRQLRAGSGGYPGRERGGASRLPPALGRGREDEAGRRRQPMFSLSSGGGQDRRRSPRYDGIRKTGERGGSR